MPHCATAECRTLFPRLLFGLHSAEIRLAEIRAMDPQKRKERERMVRPLWPLRTATAAVAAQDCNGRCGRSGLQRPLWPRTHARTSRAEQSRAERTPFLQLLGEFGGAACGEGEDGEAGGDEAGRQRRSSAASHRCGQRACSATAFFTNTCECASAGRLRRVYSAHSGGSGFSLRAGAATAALSCENHRTLTLLARCTVQRRRTAGSV